MGELEQAQHTEPPPPPRGAALAAIRRREVEGGAVLVAPRDASWYAYPGRAGRYHTVRADGTPACASGARVVMELAKPPGQVDSILLCRRQACVNARRKQPAEGEPDE